MSTLYDEILDKYSNYELNWDKLHNKSIMLSGATGLIGRFLIDLIMKKNEKDDLNCKIIALCRDKDRAEKFFDNYSDKNLVIFEQDVIEPIKYLDSVDFVIHGASNTHPVQYATDPIGTIETNVYGANNLLKYSRDNSVKKFLLMSSFEVYGRVGDTKKIKENDFGIVDCTILRSCYPESKRLSESLAIAYSSQEGVNVSIVRLSRVFGPTMLLSSSLATAQFIKNVINNENIVLKSDGSQLYSYNYVGDAVTAILTVLLEGKDKEAYNVSDISYDLSLGEFAQLVSNYNGKEVIFDIPDEIEKIGFSNSVMTVLDSTKLKKLGWSPIGTLESDINDTINVIKKRKRIK